MSGAFDCIVELFRRPAGDFFCIIQDLDDCVPARFGIAPEFGFNKYRQAGFRNQDKIDWAGWCLHFPADRRCFRKRRLNLLYRENVWLFEKLLLKPVFRKRIFAAVEADWREPLRRSAIARKEDRTGITPLAS